MTSMRNVTYWLAVSLCGGLAPMADAASPEFVELVSKIARRPAGIVESIQRMRLREDLETSGQAVGQALRKAGLPVRLIGRPDGRSGPSPTLRVGVERHTLDRLHWWHHFSDPAQRLWADVVRFTDVEAARDFYRLSRQRHSGMYGWDHLAFLTTSPEERNSVSILVRKDEFLLHL